MAPIRQAALLLCVGWTLLAPGCFSPAEAPIDDAPAPSPPTTSSSASKSATSLDGRIQALESSADGMDKIELAILRKIRSA